MIDVFFSVSPDYSSLHQDRSVTPDRQPPAKPKPAPGPSIDFSDRRKKPGRPGDLDSLGGGAVL
ncbi:hypothetical protein EXW72_19585 [Pseudomonas sp. BCA14]|uniref:hypothetical protein n=1 Tax=unclassified Pseudomonas TaxID=196821 RepID=UPI00106E4670|nr:MULTISPECIES: hypothetical protein [unclassified Pseudomonas]TFF05834.1 hypothetical protein EXW70_18405 [Pseudomonas sp. JMN1]TFF08087.1 hypothetical protein EXW71_19005 [Pseudomonas sp. BCA17]TFF23998.1 hypothetical protein EXW72_19585 [Pseudomonas sp. BCA14]TFF28249.1 hypothetical protein EXW73_12585 [Pseudomonas sp. BCA13]